MKIFIMGVVACATAGIAASAEASYLYSFDATSSYGSSYGSFTYTSPNLVTSYTFIPAGSLDSCNTVSPPAGVCAFVQLVPNYIGYDTVWYNGDGSGSTVYYFAAGVLSNLGSYSTVLFGTSQAATLSVSLVNDGPPPSVIEPASWAMMLGGFGMMGAALRRRPKTSVSFG